MIICPPDCPERKQGCHSNCERYEKNLADYRERRKWLDRDRSVGAQVGESLARRNNIYVKRKIRSRETRRNFG